MERPKAPCKGCEDREIGCHAWCKKYQEYRQEMDAYNLLVRKNKGVDV